MLGDSTSSGEPRTRSGERWARRDGSFSSNSMYPDCDCLYKAFGMLGDFSSGSHEQWRDENEKWRAVGSHESNFPHLGKTLHQESVPAAIWNLYMSSNDQSR